MSVVWDWIIRQPVLEVGVISSPDSDLQSGCNVSSGGTAGAVGWRGVER